MLLAARAHPLRHPGAAAPAARPPRGAAPPPLRSRRRVRAARAAAGDAEPLALGGAAGAAPEPLERDGAGGAAAPGPGFAEDGAGGVALDLELPRRSMLVTFTCDRCEARTERLVNPLAWARGLVICQCAGCKAWHKLADETGMVEEIRFCDEPGWQGGAPSDRRDGGAAPAAE